MIKTASSHTNRVLIFERPVKTAVKSKIMIRHKVSELDSRQERRPGSIFIFP